jgi:hypothetical protein
MTCSSNDNQKDRIKILKLLLSCEKVDPLACDCECLSNAAENDASEILEFLIDNGRDWIHPWMIIFVYIQRPKMALSSL